MTAPNNAGTPNILIVDDDPLVVHALAKVLRPYGQVSFTMDFDMVHVTAALARPKVILLDVDLPGVTGLEITRKIRENPELDGTPVVLMTAHRCGTVLNEAEHLVGDDRVMLKPIDMDSVTHMVSHMLSQGLDAAAAAPAHH